MKLIFSRYFSALDYASVSLISLAPLMAELDMEQELSTSTVGLSFAPSGSCCSGEKVEIRVVVFRPFEGEILLGRIAGSSDQGMKSEVTATRRSSEVLMSKQYALNFLKIFLCLHTCYFQEADCMCISPSSSALVT